MLVGSDLLFMLALSLTSCPEGIVQKDVETVTWSFRERPQEEGVVQLAEGRLSTGVDFSRPLVVRRRNRLLVRMGFRFYWRKSYTGKP